VQITGTTLQTRKLIYMICEVVCERGGRLAGAGVVGLLKKIGRDSLGQHNMKKNVSSRPRRTVVAMDGGLYEHYGKYRDELQDAVTELVGKQASENIIIELSKDGSGIGAALLAASHSQHL
jgi:hexokinase